MSKLNEFLKIKDEQVFRLDNINFKVSKDKIFFENSDEEWDELVVSKMFYEIINRADEIQILSQKD